jgi:hypothetical protein
VWQLLNPNKPCNTFFEEECDRDEWREQNDLVGSKKATDILSSVNCQISFAMSFDRKK